MCGLGRASDNDFEGANTNILIYVKFQVFSQNTVAFPTYYFYLKFWGGLLNFIYDILVFGILFVTGNLKKKKSKMDFIQIEFTLALCSLEINVPASRETALRNNLVL